MTSSDRLTELCIIKYPFDGGHQRDSDQLLVAVEPQNFNGGGPIAQNMAVCA